MFDFIKRHSLLSSGILNDSVDFHTHILPDVDDGLKVTSEATSVLDCYSRIGIKRIVLTPHVMNLFPGNDFHSLMEKYELFKQTYHGDIEIQLGAEYMMDGRFEEHLKSGNVLTLFDKHILIECPARVTPYDFLNRMNRVMLSGYFVVLAHPERYIFLNKHKYYYLKEIGVKFQLNLFSLLGAYGGLVRKNARFLLNSDSYDLWGTDLHTIEHFRKYINKKALTSKDLSSLMSLKEKMNVI